MKKLTKILFIVGIIFIVLPFMMGVVMTVFSMIFAFHDLSQNGIADPPRLAGHVGVALSATAIGLAVSVFGVILLIITGGVHVLGRAIRKASSN